MRWSFKKLNLTWYEYGWAALPFGLVAVGGIIGGICGGAAVASNLYVMRGKLRAPLRYAVTGIVSLCAAGTYYGLTKVLTISIGLTFITADRVDRDLQKLPVYVALKKVDPGAYSKLVAQLTDASGRRSSPADLQAIARQVLGAEVGKQVAHASDQAVIDTTRVLTLTLDQIGAKSADACFNFLFPRPDITVDLAKYITPEVAKLGDTATVAVLETSSASPQPIPERQDVAVFLNQVRSRLVANYGEDAVAMLGKPSTLDHAKVCGLTSALYKEVLSLPRGQAVPLLRISSASILRRNTLNLPIILPRCGAP